MNLMYKLVSKKALITGATAIAMTMAMAPAVFAQPNADTFGLNAAKPAALGGQDVRTTIAGIINIALSLLGVVALVIILVGGFKWMTAGGNEEKVTEARQLIFSGIIGLAIILSAFAIARYVLNSLITATGSSATQAQ